MSDLDHLIYDGCGNPSATRQLAGSVRPTVETKMIEYKCAYRHLNGDVEGFVGYGFQHPAALADCHEQIRRKVTFGILPPVPFDESRIITAPQGLTTAEFESIKNDWKTGLRYDPAGNPIPGGNKPPGQSGT